MEILGEQFIRYAAAASFLIGGLCAFLGVYVVLKRIVFVGVALSEVSALGVAAGLLIGINPVPPALMLAVAAVLLLWLLRGSRAVSGESIVGFTYVFAAALAIILIAKNPVVQSKGLDLVSGNLLYVQPSDLVVAAVLAVIVLGMHVALYRNFLFASFDIETAKAAGLNARLYDLLIYMSVGVSAAVTMKVAGVLFVFGSLVVPPLAALILFRRMVSVFIAAVVFSIVSSAAGIVASVLLDWPTSPTIQATGCVLLCAIVLVRAIGGAARGAGGSV